jgi:subtilisin family serine protease
MKKPYLIFPIIFAFCLVGSIALGDGQSSTVELRKVGNAMALAVGNHGYVTDEILIKYRDGVGFQEQRRYLKNMGARSVGTYEALRVQRVKLKPGTSVEQALEQARAQDTVETAEPNYLRSVSAVPSYTNFGKLWAFRNTGQAVNGVTGISGADIGVTGAWDMSTGSRGVVVAVIDSGLLYNHPDLAANVWRNPNESCTAGMDLDQNGFVGDCRGWNFVDDNNDPLDFNGHGTHVTGIIGAAGGGASALVGVNWSVSIMPLRVLDSAGYGTTGDVIAAVNYATRMGAQVINASLGGADASQLEREAIQAFVANGGLFVAAAGNTASNIDSVPFYPASYRMDGLIGVAATDSSDSLASWSSYGPSSAQVAAPGTSILSSYIPSRTTVWQDTFSGALAWTTGGAGNSWGLQSTYLSDSPAGNYLAGTNSWARSPAITLSTNGGCQLSYRLILDTVQNVDYFYTEVSPDGVSWSAKTIRSGSTNGVQETVTSDLSAYSGQSLYVRFRLYADPSSGGRDGARISNAAVTCYSQPDSSANYAYMSGTSMATPMVSGLAALIKAVAPGLTNLQVAQVIETSADWKSTLAGKVRSGGRINANKAVNMAALGTPNLTAQLSSGSVNLTWSPASTLATSYLVQRGSTTAGPYTTIASLAGNQTSYFDSGVSGADTYYYQVRAANSITESLPSNQVAVGGAQGSSGDGGGGGGGGGGGCFIATAAFGSYLAPEVSTLRHFRDSYLMRSPAGRYFVALYYRHSPVIAETIRRHEVLRTVMRIVLTPIAYGVKYLFFSAAVIFICPFAVLALMCLSRSRARMGKSVAGSRQ